ncbi:ECF-type riboflavin transporter substrate-binding protein [Aquella oligotrophica]|uniref:ECF-type riboflavin transporter substrate-binding protein n=1 Tax=Aquella oligotrophica TaxID=2067065 RepID=UPI00131543E7|nr:ECF-type riboflavin transporter substrate-binding protein [Aquella oligotrophica]
MKPSIFDFNTRTVVTISIVAALYGVVGLVGIPVGPNVQLRPSIIILSLFSVYFGPVVGFLGGFLGNMLTDLLAGWGIWWTWEMASGIFGLFCGLVYLFPGFNVRYGLYSKIHLAFLIVSAVGGFLAGYTFAGISDIIIMNEPPRKVFFQIIVIFITNSLVFIFLALPVIFGFIKANNRYSRLKVEE